MAEHEHKAKAPDHVRCYVLSVSDTRTPDTDYSGKLVQELLRDNYQKNMGYALIKDDKELIQRALTKLKDEPRVDVVLIVGGTGISPRDVTIEACEALFDKTIDGFGEVFRTLSYEEMGTAAILSRATAGVIGEKVVVAMPGSLEAVRLAMNDILLPELSHMVYEVKKRSNESLEGTDAL